MIDGLRARGWRFYVFVGDTGCRFMCAWDTTERDVDLVGGKDVADSDALRFIAAGESPFVAVAQRREADDPVAGQVARLLRHAVAGQVVRAGADDAAGGAERNGDQR